VTTIEQIFEKYLFDDTDKEMWKKITKEWLKQKQQYAEEQSYWITAQFIKTELLEEC